MSAVASILLMSAPASAPAAAEAPDPDDLAYLLLFIIRGTDVVGAAGHSPARLTSIAESAFALLPRPRE